MLEKAFPVLEALAVPATVFVPTAYVAGEEALKWASMEQWAGTPFADELGACPGPASARCLRLAGRSVRTAIPTPISPGWATKSSIGSWPARARCEEEIDRPCRTLAYPFSAYDRRVMDRARAAGYEAAVILDNYLAIPVGSLVRPGED